MDAISIPIFKPISSVAIEVAWLKLIAKLLAETLSTIIPSICGAIDAPKSPDAAIRANAATPGFGTFSSIKISVPGQSIAEKIPTKIQARNDKITLPETPITT